MATPPADRPTDDYFRDPDCPTCQQVPDADEVVACRVCARVHHLGCWLLSKGCGEPGCQGTSVKLPTLEGPPPEAPPEPVVLTRRAEWRMWFFVFLVVYVLAMYASLFLLPDMLQHSMAVSLGLGFLFGCTGLLLVQQVVTRGYRFDPVDGFVGKHTQAGPFVYGQDRRWRHFKDVQGLDIQLVRRTLSLDGVPSYIVQVWIRYPGGADLILREEELDPSSARLLLVLRAARMTGAPVHVMVVGEESKGPQLRVSRITGMPLQAPP